MNNRSLCLLATLVLSVFTGGSLASPLARPHLLHLGNGADFGEDQAEFKTALATWKQQLGDCEDRAEKRALRKAHPAAEFADRMRAHFAAGKLPAADWCLDYLSDMDLKRKVRENLRLELYDTLISAVEPKLRKRTLERMLDDSSLRRAVKLAGVEERVRHFLKDEPDSDQRGRALSLLAQKFCASRKEAEKAHGVELLRGLLASPSGGEASKIDLSGTTLSAKVRKEVERTLFAMDHLAIGKRAPEFTGKTIDGESITLADTRGKVTVLSFFGFW